MFSRTFSSTSTPFDEIIEGQRGEAARFRFPGRQREALLRRDESLFLVFFSSVFQGRNGTLDP